MCNHNVFEYRLKIVDCLQGQSLEDEDLTQSARIIPLPKWSLSLFPNRMEVLQEGKHMVRRILKRAFDEEH